ncbi:NAD-dependent epimerase/dehydratase family protein [Paenibacillus sp.]|uniref:NAD-dependent epimerase/dehydratase family protein n=1 Tax=Paenibacillus sp. TaxID=58172 RepID=UPI002811C1CB|nr:NAD-dependent epimerase/dehydratase family protein [Paenibacillus sp.]
MKILVLGGTRFVGKHMVEAATARGHEVTLFNRNQRPGVFPDLETLVGDRDGDLKALEGRTWDAVIDTCGYVPRIVKKSLEALASRVGHYTFISTLDVYDQPDVVGIDENHPLAPLTDESIEDVHVAYGPLKARCEQEVERAMPGRSLIVRCGLVVGPGDLSDRFTYWPTRIARGGETLAPGNPNAPIQWIDARDLAEWVVRMIERQAQGVFNATGPEQRVTVGDVLSRSNVALGSPAEFVWVEEPFLLEQGVGFWIEMPLWLPKKEKLGGIMTLNVMKAVREGLTFRPLEDTVRDTLAWDRARGEDVKRVAGLDAEKERRLLDEWRRASAARM